MLCDQLHSFMFKYLIINLINYEMKWIYFVQDLLIIRKLIRTKATFQFWKYPGIKTTQASLGDIAGLATDRHNEASITTK